MQYLIAIERGDAEHAFGVVVPDLPGCYSAGDTFEEAVANAREAIELHLEGLLDSGEAPPAPRDSGEWLGAPEFAGWVWATVPINPDALDDKVERINVTIPRRVLVAIDRAAEAAHTSRSSFLAEAGLAMARQGRRPLAAVE